MILRIAGEEGRIIITNDKGFGEMVFFKKEFSHGLILLRANDERAENKVRLVAEVMARVGERIKGNFIVVNEAGIRVRTMTSHE